LDAVTGETGISSSNGQSAGNSGMDDFFDKKEKPVLFSGMGAGSFSIILRLFSFCHQKMRSCLKNWLKYSATG
jgi:hypothetical protein